MSAETPIASPCVDLCEMDAARGLCRGCWRTIDEIAGWARFDESQKRKVLAAIEARRRNRDAADR